MGAFCNISAKPQISRVVDGIVERLLFRVCQLLDGIARVDTRPAWPDGSVNPGFNGVYPRGNFVSLCKADVVIIRAFL